MIKIRVSILLAFSLLPKKSNDKQGKKDKAQNKKKPKNLKNDKFSKTRKLSKKKGNEVVTTEKPKHVVEVGSPVGFSHIEYVLIPGRPKYQIDVLCWGPVAKVFSADGDVTLTTFIKNEVAWVPISLQHILNSLEEADIFKLYNHVVNYTIWTTKNKMCSRAKSENTKIFFIREEDIDSSEKFTKAYNRNPNLEKCENEEDRKIRDLEREIKNILWECADTPGVKNYDEIVTRHEFLSDRLHHFQVNKIIDAVTKGETVICKDLVPVCPSPSTDEDILKAAVVAQTAKLKKTDKKGKNKDTKKTSKDAKEQKGKGAEVLKIAVPGEVFYTDPTLSIYDLKTSSLNIIHGFVLTSTTNLMSRPQKYSLNPLIIKIKKISNLPVKILKDHRFSTIYAHYNIPYIARCSTIEKPLAPTIQFNEAHAHFTNSVPKLKILEFVQTQRLYIEIRGVREESKNRLQPNVFGCEQEDQHISNRLTAQQCSERLKKTEEATTVTLAVACYDISLLLQPVRECLETAYCHHPDTLLFQNAKTMYESLNFIDVPTINEINLGGMFTSTLKSLSPLTESLLSDFGTTLEVEVYLSAPHNAMLEVHRNPEIFRRLCVVVNYPQVAMTIFNGICGHNQTVLGPEVIFTNFLKYNSTQSTLSDFLKTGSRYSRRSMDHSVFPTALTGFMIDNGGSYLIFLEGLANGIILNIWHLIMNFDSGVLKSFYNSNSIFERRLYKEFLNFGGFYVINLRMPFEEILGRYGSYLQGNIPIPCFQALKKLNLLLKCSTLQAMMQYCLLPTPQQLLSLDMEWGVPFKWKQLELSDNKRAGTFCVPNDLTCATQLQLTSETTLMSKGSRREILSLDAT